MSELERFSTSAGNLELTKPLDVYIDCMSKSRTLQAMKKAEKLLPKKFKGRQETHEWKKDIAASRVMEIAQLLCI